MILLIKPAWCRFCFVPSRLQEGRDAERPDCVPTPERGNAQRLNHSSLQHHHFPTSSIDADTLASADDLRGVAGAGDGR